MQRTVGTWVYYRCDGLPGVFSKHPGCCVKNELSGVRSSRLIRRLRGLSTPDGITGGASVPSLL